MLSPAIVRASLVSLAALSAAPVLLAASARETVYFTTPFGKISRANFATSSSQTAVTDFGTIFNGLVVRYDGNDVVTLLAANDTLNGDVRAYRCASPTGSCEKLGTVFSLKKAQGVALDTFGNLYAVNSQLKGADQLVFAARKPSCPTTTGTELPAGCFPGGYGPAVVIDSQVDGVTEVADVEVEAATGDVIVLASKPAKLLRYLAADVKTRVGGGVTEPAPTVVPGSFAGHTPSGLALFPTGEIFVVTCQGKVLVFSGGVSNIFTTIDGPGSRIAIGVEGGAAQDPVASGRVLVTGIAQVLSFGIARVDGQLVASPAMPDANVWTILPFGVADASLGGSVYTPASAGPLVVQLPLGHEVTFEKINTGGLTQGSYQVIGERSVRGAATASCPEGSLTLEGVTRCIPSHVRGYPLAPAASCDPSDTTKPDCYYLVFVADTGANLFGGTQQHHFEEDEFGFTTNCYLPSPYFPPDPKQPRVFHGTDANDPVVVEGEDVFDITSGCGSHIGRGGQFSMFVTGWDALSPSTIATQKLDSLRSALLGTNAYVGGLAPYITDSKLKSKLAYYLNQAQQAWDCHNKELTVSYLDSFVAKIQSSLVGFTECPGSLPCRNAPGELAARADSAAFMACGAKKGCQRLLE